MIKKIGFLCKKNFATVKTGRINGDRAVVIFITEQGINRSNNDHF